MLLLETEDPTVVGLPSADGFYQTYCLILTAAQQRDEHVERVTEEE
jgi:hypothetical protein